MLHNKASIITVKELLLKDNLQIPNYQRPYKWTTKNVNQLIDDIILFQDKSAYRLGTLVIHKEKKEDNTILNIVDGQQRSITLTLIAYALIKNKSEILKKIAPKNSPTDFEPKLINLTFSNEVTKYNIRNNFNEIERRINDFDEKITRFFFDKCEIVQVILTDISEAFQFFDSQNSRGKDLEPHDLLKAFHLREMADCSTSSEKTHVISTWESMETEELSDLFGIYLYRIRNWSKGYSARYFTKNEVDVFKGINPQNKNTLPYAQLFKIGHYYTENYNNDFNRKIDNNIINYPFQIDQTIINGKRFFEMISYYKEIIDKIKLNKFNELSVKEITITSELSNKIISTISNYEGRNRTGDKYVKVMFDCCLLYYIDKFGTKDISKAIEKM